MTSTRSWQRVLLLGLSLLIGGAIATVVHPDGSAGLVHDAVAVVGVIALGIGASIIASGLVARLVARQVFGIDIGDAVEALRGASPLTRSNQTITILLDVVDEEVYALAEHRFELLSSSRIKRRLPFCLFTDLAQWGSGAGFSSIVEPGGNELKDDALARYVDKIDGKWQFEREYEFRPHQPAEFVVETFGYFRRSDRLIWTVEHISTDFTVKIVDRRRDAGPVHVRINHHRAPEIIANKRERDTREGSVIEFVCRGEVLPYQGFELQWTESDDAEADAGPARGAQMIDSTQGVG